MTAAFQFRNALCDLVSKYDYSVEETARRADTMAWVVREWMRGSATPCSSVQKRVLNALDTPNEPLPPSPYETMFL